MPFDGKMRRKAKLSERLTFCAVRVVAVLLPSWQALLDPLGVAVVVAVLVVPGLAVGVAVGAVVGGGADHAVLKVELLTPLAILDVLVLLPFGAGLKPLPVGGARNQNFCK